MNYQVIEAKVWEHKETKRHVSIYGASPWTTPADKPNWVIVTTGWTVQNPFTGEVGIGRPAWGTREAAQDFADQNRPSRLSFGD